ncbi:MAG: Arc family DNA-binding protein [Brucellaceae bacterium]|jgi:hypothetical protein|nr:Arc family DNA-binding protein [Brucellaceae bacterium]
MSEEVRVQFKFMIPSSLKLKLEEAAHDKRRSLSAEIIARLENSLSSPAVGDTDVSKELAEMKQEIKRLAWSTRLAGKAIQKAADGDQADLEDLIEIAKTTPLLAPITEDAERELEQEIDNWMESEATPTKAKK